jgi:hypothetical protein
MAISIGKLAPRVVALAVMGYCAWPSLSELMSKPEVKPPPKTSPFPAGLLSPKLAAFPTRDPFGGSAGVTAALAEQWRKENVARVAAKSKAATDAKTGAAALVNPLNGLTLDGTCIVGDQRLAVISGRLYAPQETLPAAKGAAPLRVVDVLPYKVLLDRDGKALELAYSDTATARAADPKSTAKPSGAPKPKRAGGSSKKKGK